MKLKYQLPEVYQQWLPKELLQTELIESKATCHNCLMSQKPEAKVFYQADLKCCTFEPFIPNFAVGGILESTLGSSAVRTEITQKIESREYALPIGLVPSVRFQIEFNNKGPNEFGQREDWLCPYFDKTNSNCGIWRHRGSVCTSFYCKSSFGKKGLKFWKNFESYLSYVEMAMMEECLAYLDFSPRQVSELTGFLNRSEGTASEKRSWVLPEKEARRLWNGYFDDQIGFYKKCSQLVRGFDRKHFRETAGDLGQQLEQSAVSGLKELGI